VSFSAFSSFPQKLAFQRSKSQLKSRNKEGLTVVQESEIFLTQRTLVLPSFKVKILIVKLKLHNPFLLQNMFSQTLIYSMKIYS
jgi:hypothetical protein